MSSEKCEALFLAESPVSGPVLLVLHDQLNRAFFPPGVEPGRFTLLFMESGAKGRSLPYHKKKLVFVLSAQRHFALDMADSGFSVRILRSGKHYDVQLTDFLQRNPDAIVHYLEPAEHDSRERLERVLREFDRVKRHPNPCFLSNPQEWKDKIKAGYRMEFFYREMRRRTGFLMDSELPAGGKWNFDEENRKPLPRNVMLPQAGQVEPDAITKSVMELVDRRFSQHPGSTDGFSLAVTRTDALALLSQFIKERLAGFGPYEDAMKTGESLLFHSGLSYCLNNGLLLPAEVCECVEQAWKRGEVSLASAEGFIRQVIGWREYIRAYYEAMMPEVRSANALGITQGIPEFYWSGDTEMHCLKECVGAVKKDGFTHHIPRLMVLSNFATLSDTDPAEVLRWFHAFFVDAYEWVVLPNVLGMSTYADGGILASKPYVASGNYINGMSDFCKKCRFKVKEKFTEDACPFNALYWRFVHKNSALFEESGRSSFVLQYWEKQPVETKKAVLDKAESFLTGIRRYRSVPSDSRNAE